MTKPMPYEKIVLISLDTLRSDCIAANPFKLWPQKYGALPAPRTDVLDELVRQGAFFPNCIASAPYTSAAHASVFTGKWPINHGCYELFNHRVNSRSIFTEAQSTGYRTLFKTDFPVTLGPNLGFDRGVDCYIVEDDERFLEELSAPGPTLAFAHFGGLHIPYGFHNLKFGGNDYLNTLTKLESSLGIEHAAPVDRIVETYRDAADMEAMVRYKGIIQHLYSRGDYTMLFRLYLEGVDYFMRNRFEPFMKKLRVLLSETRCLLVLFGDHGEDYDRESYGHHNSMSEGVLRVPVIFVAPDIAAGVHAARVRSIDIAPTLTWALDADRPPKIKYDGQSLAPVVWGREQVVERVAHVQAYTSEQREYVRFQDRMLKTGKKSGALRHVLYKEAIYDGPYKLTRQNYRYADNGGIGGLERCEPILSLSMIGGDLHLAPAPEGAVLGRLVELMDRHNAGNKQRSRQRKIDDRIRNELRSLGYQI